MIKIILLIFHKADYENLLRIASDYTVPDEGNSFLKGSIGVLADLDKSNRFKILKTDCRATVGYLFSQYQTFKTH
jgi:hypothetical protein